MYMRLLRLKIKEESIPLISDFYTRHALAPLQNAPGCQFASLLQSQQKPEELMSLTLWDSMEKAEAFSQSDVFRRLMDEVHPHLAEASEWKIQLSKEMELTYAPVEQELHIDSYQVAAQQELKPAGAAFIRFFSLIVKEEGRIAEFERLYKNEILPRSGHPRLHWRLSWSRTSATRITLFPLRCGKAPWPRRNTKRPAASPPFLKG